MADEDVAEHDDLREDFEEDTSETADDFERAYDDMAGSTDDEISSAPASTTTASDTEGSRFESELDDDVEIISLTHLSEGEVRVVCIQQHVADNIDLGLHSLAGNTSYHGTATIRISTPEPDNPSVLVINRKPLITSERKAELLKLFSIQLVPYHKRECLLNTITFRPYIELQAKFKSATKLLACCADFLWLAGWGVRTQDKTYYHMNWKGFMKTVHPANTRSKSFIEILPVIDADPNSYTAIHTTLLNCIYQSDTKPGTPIIVTFDFPLWIRATEIVLSLKMPIVVRLGGFHLLKSYLGSVGHIMSGSGIEDLIKIVFPSIGDSTVSHIMSGGAYYKALRCLFLIDAALVTHLMKGSLSDDELKVVRTSIKSTIDVRSGSGQMTGEVLKFKDILEQKLIDLTTMGRTPRLWIQFHKYVTVIKAFIRAERLHLIDLHFSCVVEMLPTFAAAGHTKYAKGARLYLEQMSEHMINH